MARDRVIVEVAGRRYVAARAGAGWRLYLADDRGAVAAPDRPAAYALTASVAWEQGVDGAADLPADELVIVEADVQGRPGRRLLSATCPPELAMPSRTPPTPR